MLRDLMKVGLVAVIAAVQLPVLGAVAAEQPRKLTWAALLPDAPPPKLKSFLSGRDPAQTAVPADSAPPATPEGRWMSSPVKSSTPPAVVTALDGQVVEMGGYVVPLDFDATSVKEFLLVPFVGACIHVPPPPPNQIVYVKAEKPFELKSTFEPVTVVGTMRTSTAFTGLADAGYTLEASSVVERTQ